MQAGADRRIMVCLDQSPSSAWAWSWARDNIVQRGDTIVLATVACIDEANLPDGTYYGDEMGVPGVFDQEAVQKERQSAMELAEQYVSDSFGPRSKRARDGPRSPQVYQWAAVGLQGMGRPAGPAH